jgi:hypothetical protein
MSNAFRRGIEWANIRRELRIQGAFTEKHLRAKEVMLWGMLNVRKEQIGVGASEERIARMMTEWLIIRDELRRERG